MQSKAHESLRIEEALARWGAGAEDVAAAVKRRVLEHCRAGASPAVIRLRLGERVSFSNEELVRALARIARGTLLAHAAVRIERIPARWFCPGCDRTLDGASCRSCGLRGVLEAGEEMVLDSIEA